MKKTIGMFAHVDAGKTTFSEQLLYHTRSIRERGRVDHRDAFLDSHEIEKNRGITVFADQATMTYGDSVYYLVDTPGHVDFSSEMERTIQVMDYAVVIISAVEGVESHTETVWHLLRKHRVPAFIFINKIDRTGADVPRVMDDIRSSLSDAVCDIAAGMEQGVMKDQLIEVLAEQDEELLDSYLEDRWDNTSWLAAFRGMIRTCRIYPVACGSALQDLGVLPFLEKLDMLTETNYSAEGAFAGRVYKIRHDNNGTRMTYMKALAGKLSVRDEMSYGDTEQPLREKITLIRLVNGSTYSNVDEVQAGDLFVVAGLSQAAVGDGVGECRKRSVFEMVPTLQSKVQFDAAVPVKEVLQGFQRLDAEDPALHVSWNEQLQEIHIHVMGAIQLEVLEQLVKQRFQMNVGFEKPEILYKETIDSAVTGYGHFEPLKHYAEVHLQIEPGPRNSGFTVHNACHPDQLTANYQHLIVHYLSEREHRGLLTGSPITDVRVTLLNGRAHNKHTHGGDFREAALRALRQGLEKADNVLLEPMYDFRIKVDLDDIGRVLSDIQAAQGSFEAPETVETKAVVKGKAPVAAMVNYSTELAAFTHGRGTIQLNFGGYDRCHNEQEVKERRGYNKNADPVYTSSSVFCSKGQGFSVPWDEAEDYMHGL